LPPPHELGGKRHGAGRTGDRHPAILEWLAHGFQNTALKLRQFVQKENAVMAREISPGVGLMLPPSRPASEAV